MQVSRQLVAYMASRAPSFTAEFISLNMLQMNEVNVMAYSL